MSVRRLLIRDFVPRGKSHHFSRMELGLPSPKDLHRHDFPELFWIEKGGGVHLLGGVRREIGSGTLIFVRPEEVHTVGAAGAGAPIVLCNLALPGAAWAFFRRRYLGGDDWFRRGEPGRRERGLDAAARDFLLRAGPELAAAPRARFVLERFLLNLAHVLRGGDRAPAPGMPGWLGDAAAELERRALFAGGAPVLARLAGRSAEHVARETRRWLGKTPTAWINEMRMRHAARLLAETRREIVDVCLECGLENVSHFYELFRARHGVTPFQYRRRSGRIVRLEA